MEGCGSTNQHAKKKQCNRPVAERYCLEQVTFKLKFKINHPSQQTVKELPEPREQQGAEGTWMGKRGRGHGLIHAWPRERGEKSSGMRSS